MIFSRLRLTVILFVLYSLVFLNALGYMLIFPSLIALLSSPKHSLLSMQLMQCFGPYMYSVVLGLGSLMAIIFAPILGRLSDLIGRKKTLIFCTFLMLVSAVLPVIGIINSSIVLFMLGNAINGISSNNQPIVQAAIADLSVQKKNKAMRFGIDTFVVCLAMMTGPLIANVLSNSHVVSWFNNSTPFLLVSILSLLALIVISIILPETNTHRASRYQWRINLSSTMLRLLFVFFCAQMAWAQFFQYLYVYLIPVRHFTRLQAAWYTGLTGVYLSVALLIVYPFMLRIPSLRTSAAWCLLIAMLGMLALTFLHYFWALWIFVVPLTFGIAMYFPSLLTLFSDLSDRTQQGLIMAIATVLIGIAWLVTGFSAIYFAKLNVNMPLVVSCMLLVIAWLVMEYDCQVAK